MQLDWTPNLSFGHDEIDKQHQELFKAFDDFIRGCARGEAKVNLLELHGYLEDYIENHFSAEETLMRRHGFPGITHHLREHQGFRKKIATLRDELSGDGPTLPILVQTNKALVAWLVHHIQEMDQLFGKHLKETGQL
jgi:hemerythrin